MTAEDDERGFVDDEHTVADVDPACCSGCTFISGGLNGFRSALYDPYCRVTVVDRQLFPFHLPPSALPSPDERHATNPRVEKSSQHSPNFGGSSTFSFTFSTTFAFFCARLPSA